MAGRGGGEHASLYPADRPQGKMAHATGTHAMASPRSPTSSPTSRPAAWPCSSTRRTARTRATSIFAADFVTPEKINFMARHGRGLICMPITAEHAERLDLRADGRAEPLGARHELHGVDRGGDRRDHRHLGGRTARTRSASRPRADAKPVRHRAARPRVSADRAARRRAGRARATPRPCCDLAALAGSRPRRCSARS